MNTESSNLTPYEAGLAARAEQSAVQAALPPALPSQSTNTPPPLPRLSASAEDTDSPEEKPSIDKAVLYPRILRWTGATILGISALCFLISGWVDSTPLLRTGSFLGFTALLTAAGVFCATRWSEDKGARTFLALATAFLPANFAQLGAMIYAQCYGSSGYSQGLKGVFTFAPVGVTTLLLSTLGCLVVLLPIAYTGFSALARSGAKKMTALFLAGNTLLLLPWRDANVVAALGAVMVTGLVIADRKWLSKETALKTWDGIAMRSLLFAPEGLLLARNLMMHDITAALFAFISGSLALVFFSGLPRCLHWKGARITSQYIGYACGWVAWVCSLATLFHDWPFGKTASLPIVFLPWCLGVFALSFKSEDKGNIARGLTSLIALGSCWLNLEWCGDLSYLPSIVAMLVAVGLLLAAFVLEEKAVLIAGIITLLVALGYHVHFALEMIQGNLWISLALAGTCIILAASYLERNGIGLRQRMNRVRKHWQGWH